MNKLFKVVGLSAALALIVSGCGGGGKTGNGDKASVTANGTFPIVEEKTEMEVLSIVDAYVQDINTNEFTQWYEEQTNVHINWNVLTGSSKEKLNVLLASGEYPDVFLGTNLTQSEQFGYGTQGIFLPLNDLIKEYGPNVTKALEEKDWAKEQITAPDGSIYALPGISETYHSRMPKKMWVYTPLREELNIPVPQTTEDFYQMLKAFKEYDSDIVPLAGSKEVNNEILPFLMNSFIYTDIINYLMIDNDGKVKFVANTPEFKEGLAYMRKLAAEGLLDGLSFTQDRKALTRLAENPEKCRLGAVPSLTWLHFTADGGETGRYREYDTIPPLEGPNGVRMAFDRGYQARQGAFAISNACENPEMAMRWVDWFYTQEGKFRSTMGKENEGWRYAQDGELGIDGRPAVFKRLIPFGTVGNSHWSQLPPVYNTLDDILSEAVEPGADNIEKRMLDETKNNYELYSGLDHTVPYMFFTQEDTRVINNLTKAILDYVNQFVSKAVLGEANLDADWDAYVNELERLGVGQYVETYQKNYELYKKN